MNHHPDPQASLPKATSDCDTDAELEAFRTRCFWWVAAGIPLRDLPREQLRRGLQTFGGHAGMRLAARLQQS